MVDIPVYTDFTYDDFVKFVRERQPKMTDEKIGQMWASVVEKSNDKRRDGVFLSVDEVHEVEPVGVDEYADVATRLDDFVEAVCEEATGVDLNEEEEDENPPKECEGCANPLGFGWVMHDNMALCAKCEEEEEDE